MASGQETPRRSLCIPINIAMNTRNLEGLDRNCKLGLMSELKMDIFQTISGLMIVTFVCGMLNVLYL